MNKRLLKYTELTLFYAAVVLNIWIVCHFTYFGGVDGPSHLYYSRILKDLISGDNFLSGYFVLNHLPVPNLTDHYLLALFDVFFRSAISEKILLIIFVAGFPLAFRAIIKRYNPDGIAATTLIIPFTHCTLLYMGAYNFCLSFTFLFVAIYYYFKNFSSPEKLYSPFNYFLFFLLILLNYFTNGISFLFLMLLCSGIEVYWVFRQYKIQSLNKLQSLKRVLFFGMLWVPGLIMLFIFNASITSLHHANSNSLPFGDLFSWVYDLKCITLTGANETFYTHLLFFGLIIAFALAVYFRIKSQARLTFMLTDIFLLLFVFTFIAYLIVPQGASVGMISDRLLYYFIVFLVLWIALQKIPNTIALMLSGAFLTVGIIMFFNTHYPILTNLDNDAVDVQKAGKYVEPNSVVYIFRFNQNPLEPSLSNILGVDKPLVILERYEPDYGWFAVKRNMEDNPDWAVYKSPDNCYVWADKKTGRIISYVDYLFVYGDYYLALKNGISDLKYLTHTYTKIYSSADNRMHVLRLNR